MCRSIANYYYTALEHSKAIDFMKKSLEHAKSDQDEYFIQENTKTLELMIKKPNPYEVPEGPPMEEMTPKQYQDATRKAMEFFHVELDGKDKIGKMVGIAIDDLDPTEYFRHCENLRVKYLTTSPVGQTLGLQTLGQKLVWCKHAGAIQGFSLQNSFELFKEHNCKECPYKKPRRKEWSCNVKWVQEQEKDPALVSYVKNMGKI